MSKSYAVFGLGKYGRAVAEELVRHGADVLAVDIDETKVNAAASEIPLVKCADVTNADVLHQLGISSIDVVIVAMANSLEASVLTTMLCKEMKVGTLIVKCSSEVHRNILKRVGADRVVFPERESGVRLAKDLLSSGFVDIIDLSGNVSLVELDVKRDWIGKSLMELNLRRKYAINIVAIRQNGNVSIAIDPEKPLDRDMKLIVIAESDKLKKLK